HRLPSSLPHCAPPCRRVPLACRVERTPSLPNPVRGAFPASAGDHAVATITFAGSKPRAIRIRLPRR
ncbi:MAG: hypothetical protein J0H57_26435, partial [Rhodospirillales bacterium]|nr:hypothetical protein [Rhodospirillales bacterium]